MSIKLILILCTDYPGGRSEGLFPPVFNLGNHATIQANATCGLNKQENKLC